jgi:hypothetical protein
MDAWLIISGMTEKMDSPAFAGLGRHVRLGKIKNMSFPRRRESNIFFPPLKTMVPIRVNPVLACHNTRNDSLNKKNY